MKVKNPSRHFPLVFAGCLHSKRARKDIPTFEPALRDNKSTWLFGDDAGLDPGLARMEKWLSKFCTVGDARFVAFRWLREFCEE